jgi:hypothetical protein
MIGTGQRGSIPGISSAETVAPVAADVQEGVYLPLSIPYQQYWVFPHTSPIYVAKKSPGWET